MAKHSLQTDAVPEPDVAVPPPVVNPPVIETHVPQGPPSADKRTRILGLDGPRGIACLCVLVVHVGGHYSPDSLNGHGLQLLAQALVFFFALSGFLLFLPYVRALLADKKQPDTKSYLVHRVLRIFPVYIVIFLIANFAMRAVFVENAGIADQAFTDNGLGMITDPLKLFVNITLTHSFIPQYLQTGINPSWSLSLEYLFYISLPILGALIFALRRRTSLNPVALVFVPVAALVVLGAVGKLVTHLLIPVVGETDPVLLEWGPNWIAVLARSFFSLSDNFAFGMLAAVIFVLMDRNVITGWAAKWMRQICFVLLVPTILVAIVMIAANWRLQSTVVAFASGLLILAIVAPLARGEETKFAKAADWRPIKYVGTVSLSVYLWHFPVLIMVGRFGWMGPDTMLGLVRNVIIVAGVSILFSAVTYKFVEYPTVKLARRYKSRA